jgi:hypothetical protein
MDTRKGDWMQTFTGRQFWPLDPRPDEVFIQDIAHALAHQCRYAGHCRRFYSVAEHSVLLARNVHPKHRLWALLHDASEAYLVDLPRPVKRHLPAYVDAERVVMDAICRRFGLTPDIPEAVHEADVRILRDELEQNMDVPLVPWAVQGAEPLGVTLQFWTPVYAEIQFMAAFDMLSSGRLAVGAGLAEVRHG